MRRNRNKRVLGAIKWFSIGNRYGFVNRNDTRKDILVHQTAIIQSNPQNIIRSVGKAESVEPNVMVSQKG